MTTKFACSLSLDVKITTSVVLTILLGLIVYSFLSYSKLIQLSFIAVALGLFFFGLHNYFRSIEISDKEIIIAGPFRAIKIPLSRDSIIQPTANGFKGAIRLFGSGGLFGYTGLYWSKSVGRFSSYVTNRSHSILIDSDSKKIMISPDDVSGFMEAVTQRIIH